MKKWKRAVVVIVCIVLVVGAVFGCYVSDYYSANEVALDSLTADSIQESDTYITFLPEKHEETSNIGFIFYPGGKVEHKAYAPLLAALSKEGILCILPEMPFHLAVLDINAANGVQQMFPQITHWYIGGHSLGGSMAANYVSEHIEEYEGLALLAAYSTADLSQTDLNVISIYGTEDCVMNQESYQKNLINLPENYSEYRIPGGCHAYFGSYGRQEGDGEPLITPEEQILQTVRLLIDFMN